MQLPVQCMSICLLLPGVPQLTCFRAACMVSWQSHPKGLPPRLKTWSFACQVLGLKQKVFWGVPKMRGALVSVLLLIAIVLIAPVLTGMRTTVYKLDSDRFKIGMRRRFLIMRLLRLHVSPSGERNLLLWVWVQYSSVLPVLGCTKAHQKSAVLGRYRGTVFPAVLAMPQPIPSSQCSKARPAHSQPLKYIRLQFPPPVA